MADWTLEQVADRFAEAADVLGQLPERRVRGHFNTWPNMRLEFSDLVGQTPEQMRPPPPSPSAISRMEETVTWSRFLHA